MTNEITALLWIIGSSLLMCILALVGVATLSLSEKNLHRLLLPLVALSAGSLLGGAFFHMIPEAVEKTGAELSVYIYVVAGFAFFLLLEQLLHWHHCHREETHCKKPQTYRYQEKGYLVSLGAIDAVALSTRCSTSVRR